MKFRIVWIDDSQTWVNSVIDELKEAFEGKNFEPIIDRYTEVCDQARLTISNSYVDLIIIDCNLQGVNGNEFIIELRNNKCFSQIVFYSQEAENLALVTADHHFLHITPRQDFHDVIGQVAEQAYRKYNHPAFMRGLLLSEFIDLESLLDDFISQCFKEQSEFFRKSIVISGGESFSLTAKQKFVNRIIRESKKLSPDISEALENIGFTSNSFQNKIILKRNILAHAHPKYDEKTGAIKLISALSETVFDVQWFFQTRTDIHDFKNKVKTLIGLRLDKVVNP